MPKRHIYEFVVIQEVRVSLVSGEATAPLVITVTHTSCRRLGRVFNATSATTQQRE